MADTPTMSIGARIVEATTAALTGLCGFSEYRARERMGQIGFGFDVFGADILIENDVPSFEELLRPTVEAAREKHAGSLPLTDDDIEDLLKLLADVILSLVRVRCGRCAADPGWIRVDGLQDASGRYRRVCRQTCPECRLDGVDLDSDRSPPYPGTSWVGFGQRLPVPQP